MATTLAIIAVFSTIGAVWGTTQYFDPIAWICAPVSAVSLGMFLAQFCGTVPGVVLGVLMMVAYAIFYFTYDDGLGDFI